MNKNKKQLKDVKWETVVLEGFPISAGDKLHSFVGLEECTDYDFDKHNKKCKKAKKPANKRKNDTEPPSTVVPNKKVKLSNGFIVENFTTVAPSLTNEEPNGQRTKKDKNKKKKGTKPTEPVKEAAVPVSGKKGKPKLGESIGDKQTNLTPEDMLSWAEFKLPEPILKALTELGFEKPTKIQQLSLPAAIHGRRDILGAAETGSGKTLAFGLPILTGILKLKEKAAKGFDPYDLPFKKSSNKKKQTKIDDKNEKNNRLNKMRTSRKKPETKPKESSEDGYSSGDDTPTDDDDDEDTSNKSKQSTKTALKRDDDEDFIEEIEVPIRKKREPSVDEGNDSDDDDNYTHLSDMLDSDDLADNSSEDEDEHSSDNLNESENVDKSNDNDENASGNESSEIDVKEQIEEELSESEDDVEEEELSESEGEKSEHDENMQGIGCVKVIDNVEMPQPTMVKTGKPLYALILTPTRELAIQISRHLIAVAKYTGIRIATIVGGMAAVKQERVLKSGPEIVVATPGRLWELLSQGQPHLQQLESVKFLAIDETDRMVERSHFEELHPLLERLNADGERRARRQNFVFSATLTLVHDLPTHLTGKKVTKRGKIINRKVQKMTPAQKVNKLVNMIGMTEPKVVDITQDNSGTSGSLTESRITCSFEHKDAYLYYILTRHPGRTIVFCNSIGCVQRLSQILTILKCRPLPLHASMAQRQRLKNLERFRDDPRGVLVATDVAARGLDIPDVDHVIHYQVPKTAENYVHRSGRTARASKEGLTILMMEPAEGYLYTKLCRTLNRATELPLFPVPASSLAPFKDIVHVAREIDSLELKRRRASQAAGWRDKAARDMDMIIDDDDCPVTQVDPSLSKALAAARRSLDRLLARPHFPKGFSYKYPTLNHPDALVHSHENALQVMKKAIQSGEIKKEKRKSKNAPLLKLEKELQKCNKIL